MMSLEGFLGIDKPRWLSSPERFLRRAYRNQKLRVYFKLVVSIRRIEQERDYSTTEV